MKKLFIIDGNSLINRAFYALPLLANANGVYSNAVFGFINCVIKLINENKPDYLAVAFDYGRKTFRNQIYSNYKGTRKETPVELKSQFPILKDILNAMNITCIEQEGIEADDIIGTITTKSGCKNIIITGDRDSLQLINESTSVWLTQRGITDIKEVNVNNIEELYSLTPSQIMDFKALAGDSSDNIPGVGGIGEKTAINLLSKYSNIKGIYEHLEDLSDGVRNKLIYDEGMCKLSYDLAKIKTDCEINFKIEDFCYDFPFTSSVKKLFKEYNFSALLKKEDLFCAEEADNVVVVKTNAQLKEIMSSFSGNYFAFDFRNKYTFSFDKKAYVIEKEISLFDMDPIDLDVFVECIMPILNNNEILKITSDLKSHMHLLNLTIGNVFDIKLSAYLISGGNKLETEIDIVEYYNVYLEHIDELKKSHMEKLYYEIELPLVYVLKDMEIQGFKINTQTLNELAYEYKRELVVIEREILEYSLNKDLNIKSAKQLSEFLFEELGISDKGNKKHSTNAEVLAGIAGEHPVVPLIIRYRKVQKLYSTYIEPYQKLTENTDIIHTAFNQMQTVTGRLSSSEPNLQNIPVRDEEGRSLRKLFVSSFEGGSIISADYNQIELRLLANFSRDPRLVEDYNSGADIHTQTASKMLGKRPEEITLEERRMAKAVNFGIIYGISSFGLARNVNVSIKEAQNYIDIYFEKYPRVKIYLDELIADAKLFGYVKSVYGRIRYVPELKSINIMQRTFGERVAMNMPLQGSASDIIKIAMIKVYNSIKEKSLKSKLILQIHDELIVDVAPGEESIIKEILITEMQNIYNGSVPLLVEVGEGKTLYDCK